MNVEGHMPPSSDEAQPAPGVWVQRIVWKQRFCFYFTIEKVTSVVPTPSPDEVLALYNAAQEGTDAAPEDIRLVTLPDTSRSFLVAGAHRYAALGHPDIFLGDDHPVTYWEMIVDQEGEHAIAHRVSTLAIGYIKTAENRYRTLAHERFKYADRVLPTLYNNDIKRWAKDWCKRNSNAYFSEKNHVAAVNALVKLRLSDDEDDVLASARLDQLLALADDMAARKRITRPATERIPIFNGQMLKMLGRTRPTADCPLFFSEADWAALLELIRSEMDKVVNDGADDSRDGTFEAMVHMARPSTKRKRGAAADTGGQSLGLGSAGRSRDERAANRSNRRQDQQQQEEQELQQQQRRQQQQQLIDMQALAVPAVHVDAPQQQESVHVNENQAMHEAAAASLVTAEAERDAAAANTLFASIMEMPLFKELEEQSQRVEAACSEAIATKCINCISAVTMPLMCTTCSYKPVCLFCVVKFAATHQNGAIGDTAPCMSCKTPLITLADLQSILAGSLVKSMHQMLVDTMLELARVKDIEDRGLVCDV